MAASERKQAEIGVVVSKHYEAAQEKRVINGVEQAAKPEKYIVVAVSGQDFDEVTGYESPVISTVEVTPEVYNGLAFGDKVSVKFILKFWNGGSSCKPLPKEKNPLVKITDSAPGSITNISGGKKTA